MLDRKHRRPAGRGLSIDKILDELIQTGIFCKEQEDRARKTVADFKRERGNHGRAKSL